MTGTKYCARKWKEAAITFAFALIIILISLMIVVFAESPKEVKYISYIVKSGDTLWSIGEKYQQGIDIRKMVEMLAEANGVEENNIYIGEVIQIPIVE